MISSVSQPKIRVLPETVSSRIAAGEVVDRPASIVKELLDNSLDAGSSFITVEIKDGGKQLIRVTDNGEGMSRAEVQLACQRFATSKLRTEADLFRIETFGFRGEALPSIASVSQLSIVTTCGEENVGTYLRVDGGKMAAPEDWAGALGTRVEVANLFFNTPGRQKFLKSTVTEFSHISHVVHQAALANPHTHFRLEHRDRDVLDYPAVETLMDRATQLYGAKFMNGMMPIEMAESGMGVYGIMVNPYFARTTRSPQEIFVNRRPVKNSTVSHAIYEAYASFLPKGRHPLFALLLTVESMEVDVNVHPSKREVKFSKPDLVHRLVKEAVRRPLQRKGTVIDPNHATEEREVSGLDQSSAKGAVPSLFFEGEQHANQKLADQRPSSDTRQWQTTFGPSGEVNEPTVSYALSVDRPVRVLGQISHTYIVAQVGDEFHVLDQHTIHERVLFERLWRGWKGQSLPSQGLLLPEPIDVPAPMAQLLEKHCGELAKLGLDIEPFGSAAYVIRAIPAILGHMDYAALITDIVDDLTEWKSVASLEQRIRPVLASMACQGAVQAGRLMNEPEMKRVVQDWIAEGFPMTCPHGRRVSMHFSTDELHKIFRRL